MSTATKRVILSCSIPRAPVMPLEKRSAPHWAAPAYRRRPGVRWRADGRYRAEISQRRGGNSSPAHGTSFSNEAILVISGDSGAVRRAVISAREIGKTVLATLGAEPKNDRPSYI